MVEISYPRSSFDRNAPQQRDDNTPKNKPIWLLACYALFFLSCLNAVQTYQDQKELVLSQLEKESDGDEINYSAGAEDHVVTAGVGSSRYGGSMVAAKSRKKKRKKSIGTTFNDVIPQPSDGSKDYTLNHSPSDFQGFSFYVMADTPHTKLEEKRLLSQMNALKNHTEINSNRNLIFGIHLGGTQKDAQCAEATYKSHADLFAKGPHPIFVTPGKSDWFDCPRQDESFEFFLKHFGSDLTNRWQTRQLKKLGIKRSKLNPELFSLYVEGILLIGLHMIDPTPNEESIASRDKRMKMSMKWLAETIEGNFIKREVRGVVIMGHAGQSEQNNKFFSHTRKYFRSSSTRQQIPVMYLHGSGLEWKVDKKRSPFYDIQVDQGGLSAPCIIDVAPQRNGNVELLRRDDTSTHTILGKGLFRLDQQQGRYIDR